mmetsp:Transcript_27760/g.78567  ORF Transcript_27760/g.78567 Transcript_27760/m.78567 type:complete len:299 (+) Transcript_27760:127-1023(+)
MKGARAQKAAKAEAAAQDPQAGGNAAAKEPVSPIAPTPPKGPRTGAARPGPAVQAVSEDVTIKSEVFKKICQDLRTNELLGAAAADALEAAAGLRAPASPQCKAARELRSKVADGRGVMVMGGIEEIPPSSPQPEAPAGAAVTPPPNGGGETGGGPGGKRPSFQNEPSDAGEHDLETASSHPEKDAPEPPELNLSPKQNHMRTDLEMWVMDEILEVFGVDDSDDLESDELREDGQALKVTQLIAEEDAAKQRKLLEEWLGTAAEDAREPFIEKILDKVEKIQALGPKKKKKKPKQPKA